MSAGSVAYNLRPNKYVERHLFIELLNLLTRDYPLDNFVYISLAGPQLEDQKLIHHTLGMNKLISVEADETIWKRQEFNRRPSSMQCFHRSIGEFIDDFASVLRTFEPCTFVVWLDYASPGQRTEQLQEYGRLLSQLREGDIVKITLNANVATLGEKQAEDTDYQLWKRRYAKFQSQFGAIYPTDNHSPKEMRRDIFTGILCEIVKWVAIQATEARIPGLEPLPLSIFTYQDGHHRMLTITTQLVQSSTKQQVSSKLQQAGWGYLPSGWDNITAINVPNLTPKERLIIEAYLPTDDLVNLHDSLPFRFDSDDDESLRILQAYADHYRRYPSYFQVVL